MHINIEKHNNEYDLSNAYEKIIIVSQVRNAHFNKCQQSLQQHLQLVCIQKDHSIQQV